MKVRNAIAIAAVGVIVGTGTANADTVDDQFINALAAQGITGDRDMLISDGHQACDQYGTPALVGLMYSIIGQGYTNGQAADVITTASRTYCHRLGPVPG